jgi:hypothetical protein
MTWTIKERFYLVLAFIVAVLAAYGAKELISDELAIVVFVAALAFMIKAVEAIRSERTRREIEQLMHQKNSN